MSAHTKSHSAREISKISLFRKALLGNAVFSGLSGIFMLAAPSWLAAFLGLESAGIITGLGISLIVYVPFLVWLAGRHPVRGPLAWVVIDLDVIWVVGSALLVFTDLVPGLTITGKWAIGLLADVVAVFAILQFIGLRRQLRA